VCSERLVLVVSDEPRRVFARVVEGVLSLREGDDVADYLGTNPWGDMDAFRREIYEPMRSGKAGPHVAGGSELVIPVADLSRLNAWLDGFYEGYSGGSEWRPPRDDDRAVFERLAAQLPDVAPGPDK
jgi:hypothetical protein